MPIINGFIKKLMQYISIYTLNYDSILENILFQKFIDLQEIYHLHGKMIYNNEIKTLHFDNCLIEEYEFAKKSNLPIIPIAIDKDLEQKLELDILGLNPINDENIIALFINSKSFKSINFYYHTKNDIKNLKKF